MEMYKYVQSLNSIVKPTETHKCLHTTRAPSPVLESTTLP